MTQKVKYWKLRHKEHIFSRFPTAFIPLRDLEPSPPNSYFPTNYFKIQNNVDKTSFFLYN